MPLRDSAGNHALNLAHPLFSCMKTNTSFISLVEKKKEHQVI